MKPGLQALGRLKTGEMNKTERAYSQRLELLLRAGEILWYRFEAIKLRLADNCFLTVDFAVMDKNNMLELHDVKGSPYLFTDDAKVKMKVAASQFPLVFKVVFPVAKKLGGGWHVEEIK